MKSLSIQEQQELVIFDAIEDGPVTIGDLTKRLREAHFAVDVHDVVNLVWSLQVGPGIEMPHLPDPIDAYQVKRSSGSTARLAELRALALSVVAEEPPSTPSQPLQVSACGAQDTDDVLRFVREHEAEIRKVLASQPPAAADDDDDDWDEDEDEIDEPRTMFCITGVAVDAWWRSLPIATKADVMVGYYESCALADEPVGEITEAGRAALAQEKI